MQQSPFNNANSGKKLAGIIAKVVGKVTTTGVIAGAETTGVETVAIKTKAETIGNAPNAITITSHGEILAIDAQQKDLQMQAMVGIEVVTEGALKEDTKGIAMGIVVATVEVAVVDIKETEVATVVVAVVDIKETEEEIKVATEEVIVVVTVVDIKGI